MNRITLILKSLVLIAIIGLFAVTGCKKDNSTTSTSPETTASASQDNSESEVTSNDVLNVTDQVINSPTKGFKWYCADITWQTYTNAKGPYQKVTIDFGNDSTNCFQNVYRRGQIIVTFQGHYFKEGFTDTITFNNFYLRSRKITGTHVVSNIGNLTWNIDANITVTRPSGKFHSWSAHRQRQLTTDTVYNGNAWDKLIYKITDQTGKVTTGVTLKGNSFTIAISKPLIKHLDCFWIESGALTIDVANNPEVVVDFGTDGNCDNDATATVNGKVHNIKI